MNQRKAKLKFKPAAQHYAIVLLGDRPGCCCEMASLVRCTRTGLIEPGELERLRQQLSLGEN